ncbi:MAG: hypothetical protein DRH08_06160 [Deltaproteobacteria bacterium]|nr:MAG: hypothetical protein DRH08_06160 [Deltaproteobacteria bacterium]
MKVITVHGFNVRDGGESTIGKIEPALSERHDVCDFDYGWIGLLGVKLFGKRIARNLSKQVTVGSVGIGHSNGCMELIRACEYGAPFNHLILINPALDNDINIPINVSRVDVLHNIDDDVVTMAKWYPFSYWGDMGRVGYTGSDTRVHNHETFSLFNVSGHSAVFSRADVVVNYIDDLIVEQASIKNGR